MRKRNPAKPVASEPRPKSSDDLWLDELRAECARALVAYLKAGVNIQKPIGSLSQRELEGMAEAVTARWIRRVSERLAKGAFAEDSAAEVAALLLI